MVFARSASYREGAQTYREKQRNVGLPEVCDGTQLFLDYAHGTVCPPHDRPVPPKPGHRVGFYMHDVTGADSIALLLLLPGSRVGFIDTVAGVRRLHGENATQTADVSARLANFAVADIPARHAGRASASGRDATLVEAENVHAVGLSRDRRLRGTWQGGLRLDLHRARISWQAPGHHGCPREPAGSAASPVQALGWRLKPRPGRSRHHLTRSPPHRVARSAPTWRPHRSCR